MGTLFKFGKQDSNRANERGAASHGNALPGNDRAATASKAAAPGGNGGLFAREQISRHSMIRFSLWGVSGFCALVIAVLASNTTMSARRMEQAAAQQVASLKRATEDTEIEARRLSAAIRTLNNDRDRLFTRLTVVEKNLEDVTGAVSKQGERLASNAAQTNVDPAAQKLPQIAPVASIAAANMKPDSATASSAAAGTNAVASAGKTGDTDANAAPAQPAQNGAAPLPQSRPATISAIDAKSPEAAKGAGAISGRDPLTTASTGAPADKDKLASQSASAMQGAMPVFEVNGGAPAFGVDLGGAKSIAAMRSFWRSMTKKYPALLDKAQPLMAMRERKNGLGMELRLIAGPLKDESLAISLCHEIEKTGHSHCSAAVYDGQRLDASSASVISGSGATDTVARGAKPESEDRTGNRKAGNDKTEGEQAGDDKAGGEKVENDKNGSDESGTSAGGDAKPMRATSKRSRTARVTSEPVREPVRAPPASRSPLEQLLNIGR